MFIAALFVIAKTWTQSICTSREEQIKILWYLDTTEYYSAVKNNDIGKFEIKWIALEKITLSEVL